MIVFAIALLGFLVFGANVLHFIGSVVVGIMKYIILPTFIIACIMRLFQ